jgi:hypothetical protein
MYRKKMYVHYSSKHNLKFPISRVNVSLYHVWNIVAESVLF